MIFLVGNKDNLLEKLLSQAERGEGRVFCDELATQIALSLPISIRRLRKLANGGFEPIRLRQPIRTVDATPSLVAALA